MRWFANLSSQVISLDFEEDNATSTGRKIQGIIAALDDVEQFEAIDTSVQIKTYISEIREIFKVMIRTVNIKREIMHVIDNISDLSYAWNVLGDYINIFHERIKKDPTSVVRLRATFIKLASILDVPLVRITAIDSPDAESVAEYYSGELVEFVRRVLEIIPVSVFQLLSGIVDIQIHKMVPIPIRPEAKDLKEYAQLDLRFELAKLSHQVSIFTEGVLVMEKTLLGIIQVDPREILQEGLRRELVRQITHALHNNLLFKELSRQEINKNFGNLASTLEGFKRSIEYIQDYIDTPGLKIYQQEISRIFSYYTEQEANRYLKKKTFDNSSRFQSKTIPIPRYDSGCAIDENGGNNFLGRSMSALLFLTDSTRTVYAPECSAWFVHSAPDQKQTPTHESCGIRTFSLLERSLGVSGLRGIDRLLAFRSVYEISGFLKFYKNDVYPFRTLFEQVKPCRF
jgi:WASH complex subunit strumpellin